MNRKLLMILGGAFLFFTSFYFSIDRFETTKNSQAEASKEVMKFHETETDNKMKIEIWSDVVCPWCYIGKRRLEHAIAKFEHAEYLEIEYKSYQLDPTMETDPKMSVVEYLSKRKGIPVETAVQMRDQVTAIAATLDLEYNMDKSIPINTLQVHELLHFAKDKNKQLEMKERLMNAYFTEALNLDDREVLLKLATEVGLDEKEALKALESSQYAEAVQADIKQANSFGVRGVPFFVFNRELAISGAQEEAVFLQTIEKAYTSWRKANPLPKFETIDGKVCTPQGKCD